MKLVVIESPYSGNVKRNIKYAKDCVKDCIKRGEAPFASHLFYTQNGILDDNILEERRLGIEAGLFWGNKADATVVYTDLGISKGMGEGIAMALKSKRKIEYRLLPKWAIDDEFVELFCRTLKFNYRFINKNEEQDVVTNPMDKMSLLFHTHTSGINFSTLTYKDVVMIEGVGNSEKIAVCDFPTTMFNGNCYHVLSRQFGEEDFQKIFGFDLNTIPRKILTEKKHILHQANPKYIMFNYEFHPNNKISVRYAHIIG